MSSLASIQKNGSYQGKRIARLYSLFEKRDNGQWERISVLALPKERAVRVWQSLLLAPYMGSSCGIRELRVVEDGFKF